mmetsp:Transcript_27582/g.64747  ORF Transcript_27582/g.64747 Transcript_27582/m.64747 type:complete len:254 (+) Transcript_27582:614-1375(+)
MGQILGLDVVRGSERSAGLDDFKGQRHRFFGFVVLVRIMDDGILGQHNGWLFGFPEGAAAGQALPELFGDERHHGMKSPQLGFECDPKSRLGGPSRVLLLFVLGLNDGFDQFQVDIAHVVQPKLVTGLLSVSKFVASEVCIDGLRSLHQAGDHKFIANAHLSARHEIFEKRRGWLEVRKVHERESRGIPHFVAEISVSHHALYVEVDVFALHGVSQESKTKRIRTAFWNAIWKFSNVVLLGACHFLGRKVSCI